MIVQVLFAFALASTALSCSTGLGDYIIQNPTFSFDFSPPISWTFFQTNGSTTTDVKGYTYYPGQVLSQADATRTMKSSINTAIYNAAQRLGYSTVGMTWTFSGYSPQTTWIVDDSVATAAGATSCGYSGTYVPGLGAVISKRASCTPPTTYTKTDYIEKLTINVKGSALYTKSQWQTFADQVFNYLSIYEKVKFRSPVTIS
jgi:hypothetical protein